MKLNRLTKKHYKYFVQRCRYWIDQLGAHDMNWDFEHKHDKESTACFGHSFDSRDTTIRLSTITGWTINHAFLDELAFHEVFESLLVRVQQAGDRKNRCPKIIKQSERHAVVNRVWHLIKGRK